MKNKMTVCYDSQACIKCFACSIACGVENRVRMKRDKGYPIEKSAEEAMPYLNHILPEVSEKGAFPQVTQITALKHCNHCDIPHCGAVCPTGAISKQTNGSVVIDQDACVGCRACIDACPYDVPTYSMETGRTYKCFMCHDRLQEGLPTACTVACPSVAIFSGTREDVVNEAKKRAEKYSQVFGKPFIVYGAEEVSPSIGVLHYITIAPEEYRDEYLLPKNPSEPANIGSVIGKVAAGVAVASVAAIGAHMYHWNKNKKNSELYHDDEE